MVVIAVTGTNEMDAKVLKVIELLDKGLAIDNAARNELRAKNTYHPSELGKCERAIYYSMIGEPAIPIDLKTLRVFDNGHYAHERLAKYLDKAAVLVEAEMSLEDEELNIKGNADALILVDGEYVLLDFKTIKSFPFKLTKDGKKELDRTYEYQMNVYCHLLRKKGYDINYGVFIFECKDDQEYYGLICPFNEVTMDDIKGKIKRLTNCIAEGVVPEGEYVIDKDWQCRFCQHRNKCYSQDSLKQYKCAPSTEQLKLLIKE